MKLKTRLQRVAIKKIKFGFKGFPKFEVSEAAFDCSFIKRHGYYDKPLCVKDGGEYIALNHQREIKAARKAGIQSIEILLPVERMLLDKVYEFMFHYAELANVPKSVEIEVSDWLNTYLKKNKLVNWGWSPDADLQKKVDFLCKRAGMPGSAGMHSNYKAIALHDKRVPYRLRLAKKLDEGEITVNEAVDIAKGKTRFKTFKSDEYITPDYAVVPVIKYLKPGAKVWCPFDLSTSAFVRVLREYGFEVVNTHKRTGGNFFKTKPPEGTDYIISNPPYSKKDQILQRLFDFKIPFAMLLGVDVMNGVGRFEMFSRYGIELMVLDKRVNYKASDRPYDDYQDPAFGSIYIMHGIASEKIVYERLVTKPSILKNKAA